MNQRPRSITPFVYRIRQAAILLGISVPTLYRLAKRGELQLVKVGLTASAIPRSSMEEFAVSRGIQLPQADAELL
ncbi:MAG: DNA-binding protein, partial [Proteobacteria bacterium]